MKKKILTLIISILVFNGLYAQETISLEDYKRASSYLYDNVNNKKLFNAFVKVNWFPDSTGVWYVEHLKEQKKYLKIDLDNLKASDLFDHKKLAAILSDSLDKTLDPENLEFSKIQYHSSDRLSLVIDGKTYDFNSDNSKLSPPKKEKKSSALESESPDKKWIAFAKNNNLYIKSFNGEKERQLSYDGTKNLDYASYYGWYDLMEGENGSRPKQFYADWSKDSNWISTGICDLRNASKMYLLDWSIDSLYRPKLLSYYRGSPGDTNIVYIDPVFYHVPSGKEIKPNLPRSPHFNAVDVEWSQTAGKVYLFKKSRGFQEQHIYSFDLKTEKLETLYREHSSTNIDNFSYEIAEENGLIFFLSEKSGWRQLYSLNLKTREDKRLTADGFYINSIVKVDEKRKKIFFMASGMQKDLNPYFQQLYSISFNGKQLKLLTPEDRNHIVSMSPDGKFFVDNMSTIQTPTKTILRSSKTGEDLVHLTSASNIDMKGWKPPQVFSTLARDGQTEIFGALWKPSNFDPDKKYPLLDYSYTGPHTQVFPTRYDYATFLQSFAELGFIVMMVDGLGSSGRSKAFHDYSYKNLGGSLEDHVMAIKELGKRHKWIDTTRVGIFGHSAGGYDAGRALIQYSDTYKVAVASSADHDHRMEKAWWPETYMGWPVDSIYHEQSNITQAGKLKGKLLIVHGGIDENVNPSASFKLAEALIRADKEFDMLILPSQRHGYTGKHRKYFRKVRWNYFLRNLREVETLWDID